MWFSRLYDGISKPLAVLEKESKALIELQSKAVGGTPTRWLQTCMANWVGWHPCVHACPRMILIRYDVVARDDKDELLRHYIAVTKADCEMNVYLVRARWWPWPSFYVKHVWVSYDIYG